MGTRVVALIVAGVTICALVVFLVAWYEPAQVASREISARRSDAQRAALAPDWEATWRLLIRSAGVGGCLIIIGVSLGIALLSIRKPLLVKDQDGVFPGTIGVKVHQPVGNHQAHPIKAGVSGPQRLPAATYKGLTRPADDLPQLPAPSVHVELAPYEVLKPDLQNYPVRLVVGRSGCGKTNLGHALLGVARHEQPGMEFVICSLVAHRWPGILSANTADSILLAAEAVHAELLRRDAYLTQRHLADAQASDLQPLLFVMDEAETVLDQMSAAQAGRFDVAIKAIVNMGRNTLIASVFLTQTGDRKILPKTINANADVLIGNSHDWVAAAFAITNEELRRQLNGAPKGRFYSLRHGAWCTFPVVKAPQVRLSRIYQAPLLLAADGEADGEADGLGAADQPDSPNLAYDAHGIRYPDTVVEGGGVPAYPGIRYQVPGKAKSTVDYDEALHRRIWAACGTAKAIKAIQEEVDMGYKGGSGFYLVRAIRRLGQAGKLPWRE
jgi:hypothetical protein